MPSTYQSRQNKRQLRKLRKARANGTFDPMTWDWADEDSAPETADERHEREQAAWLRSQQI